MSDLRPCVLNSQRAILEVSGNSNLKIVADSTVGIAATIAARPAPSAAGTSPDALNADRRQTA
jgi:hypothetical protein